MQQPSGTRRTAKRPMVDRRSKPLNLLVLFGGVLCVVIAVACAVVFSLPVQAAVTAQQSSAETQRQNDLATQSASVQQDLAATQADLTAKQAKLTELQGQMPPPPTPVPAAEVAALQAQVTALQAELAPLREANRTLKQQRGDDEGTVQLDPAVIKRVNAWLIKLAQDQNHFVCGTQIEGWYFTTVVNFRPSLVAYGRAESMERPERYSRLRLSSQFIAAWRFDGADPAELGFQQQGFTSDNFELHPKDGQAVYCICHQEIAGKPLNNSVVSGVVGGTKTINGQVFIKTSLPVEEEMAGAPVVTADGKLVGILMPRLPDVEDLSLVMPVGDIE
ncbi:MAG: hypothetical protein ACREJ2_00635, partial [Planctomycetota bacterium]